MWVQKKNTLSVWDIKPVTTNTAKHFQDLKMSMTLPPKEMVNKYDVYTLGHAQNTGRDSMKRLTKGPKQ